jgi:DNA invertase Pin-like site-specific DNA recombinase
MANALVVQRTKEIAAQSETRAAQYVRMSTNYQRYSIANQAAVIATYAQVHGLKIVRTYRDEGLSGLQIKNRNGLIQLIEDVQSGHADFRHILVYDVSRWGRFQDTDESAHYEFICKRVGVKVAYCAEQFDNDGTMLSSIVKNLKRVMAAEFSRELSAKIHAAAFRFSSMGFFVSGEVTYGLRRQLVDEKQNPKAILQRGDRKYLITDHIRLVPGPANELAVVRSIFRTFLEGKTQNHIARELNRKGVPTADGLPWSGSRIGRMLQNECYIGNIVYNRYSRKLKGKTVRNPPALWARCDGCIEPIIERKIFLRAQKIIKERRVLLSNEETLKRLRVTLMRRGKLTSEIIDETAGLPCATMVMRHFGNLREVYRLIGYKPKQTFEHLEARQRWVAIITKLGAELAAEIQKIGAKTSLDGEYLTIAGKLTISFRVARKHRRRRENHAQYWAIERKNRLPPGWMIAIRVTEKEKELDDYLLLPTSSVTKRRLDFTEATRRKFAIDRFETFSALTQSLLRRLRIARGRRRQ